ncbi:unnamed protein product [Nippostrongylus brasiliensis]|uniref:Kinesin-like protein n=1 Tax=Nippostrongylus brasiliensis TaxID=27835 RepID=A0A158R2W8_NIPBR|nr:unnamed protein product [Nippostrongylus brasiliensis]
MYGAPMDSCSDSEYFQKCRYIHEVELVNMKLQMRILETHLETKDRLIRNLEDIIDEQETRISHMEEFIQGRASTYIPSSKILKGISVLSLDFGSLREENMKLKVALSEAHKSIRLSQLTEDEDYESDIPSSEDRFRVSPRPKGDVNYHELAQTLKDDGHLKKLKRLADELKREKDELRQLALDTKEAFSVCMGEVRLMLESKTSDFFRVLIGRYCSEMQKRKQLHNQLVEINGNIRVFYRIRPQLGEVKETPAITIDEMDNGVVHLAHPSGRKTSDGADFVIPMGFTQEQVAGSVDGDIEYEITVSIMEIYNEKIRDLLASTSSPLSIRMGEDGRLQIPGLREVRVTSVQDVVTVLEEGRKSKAVATTEMNECSSRLNLVDLAGSERVSQTNATGQLLKEAQAINKSLSELGNVVLALRQNQKHIPFRNCQLTRILEDSLNGDSKTLVIVHLSPDVAHCNESASSMSFAEKIGQVQTKLRREATGRKSATGLRKGPGDKQPMSPRK